MFVTDFGILLLRLVVGLLFIGHGTQKLFGWFGGNGLKATAKFFGNLGVKPPELWALVAGLSEALGGLGLALGLITPVAAAAIIGVMLVAIIKVHWQNGIWNTQRGIEYPFVNLTIATVIGFIGPGVYSLDTILGIEYLPWLTFLIALAVVLLGVAISLVTAQYQSQSQSEQRQQSSQPR